ncbi:NAD(P)/FAD-dependent oxidoreductase [Nonomuraea sp. NPDC050556]|uniref:NAD(P)/FAD-dependent oxidoreductase n=1 Tax=Nonomuraea sp. NPDC050556 TaxID=3364369 RepID=UPI00378FC587
MRVVVIGGGIVGAAAAFHLTRRGVSVVVVDAGLSGRATDAGAGIVCPWVDHADSSAWYQLSCGGARHYPSLVELLGGDSGYARVGALLVAEDPVELDPVEALLAERYAGAPEMGEVRRVTRPVDLFPALDPSLAGLFVPGAARVNGRRLRDALLTAAVAGGAELVYGTATVSADGTVIVTSPTPAPGVARDAEGRDGAPGGIPGNGAPSGTSGEGLPGGALREGVPGGTLGEGWREVSGDVVLVAAGAWSGGVWPGLGAAVTARRGQIVHVELPGRDTGSWPIVLPQRGPYLLGFPGSRVVVGATVEDVGFDARVTVGGLEEVLASGMLVAPGLRDATVVETRVGLRPVYTAGGRVGVGLAATQVGGDDPMARQEQVGGDRPGARQEQVGREGPGVGDGEAEFTGGRAAYGEERPVIAEVAPKVIVATGLSAYGLTAGPYAGLLAACLAIGETPPLDLAPYGMITSSPP